MAELSDEEIHNGGVASSNVGASALMQHQSEHSILSSSVPSHCITLTVEFAGPKSRWTFCL